jgi:hypothetical protein
MGYGTVGILNVGAGDVKLSFDRKNPAERERAAKIVGDMIKRGFTILVEVGTRNGEPLFQRAKAFDPETCEYIIAGDAPADAKEAIDGIKEEKPEAPPEVAPTDVRRRGPGRPRKTNVRIPAERTRAVSVGRTAGG